MGAVVGRGLCVLWAPWGPAPEPSTGTPQGLGEGQAGPAELHSQPWCPPVPVTHGPPTACDSVCGGQQSGGCRKLHGQSPQSRALRLLHPDLS